MVIILKKFNKKTWFFGLIFLLAGIFLLSDLRIKNLSTEFSFLSISTTHADTPHTDYGGANGAGTGGGVGGGSNSGSGNGPSAGSTGGVGSGQNDPSPGIGGEMGGGATGGGTGVGVGGDSTGGGDSPDCFTANQLVLTPSGYVKISDVKQGEIVISYDEKLDKFTTSTVGLALAHDGIHFVNHRFEKYSLIEVGIEINGELFLTNVTENHRYYDFNDKRYKSIGEFNIGDTVKTVNGAGVVKSQKVLIDKNSSQEDRNTITYNLHMKEAPYNYVVNGAVVHNVK